MRAKTNEPAVDWWRRALEEGVMPFYFFNAPEPEGDEEDDEPDDGGTEA